MCLVIAWNIECESGQQEEYSHEGETRQKKAPSPKGIDGFYGRQSKSEVHCHLFASVRYDRYPGWFRTCTKAEAG